MREEGENILSLKRWFLLRPDMLQAWFVNWLCRYRRKGEAVFILLKQVSEAFKLLCAF